MNSSSHDTSLAALQSLLNESTAKGVPGVSAAIHTREGQSNLVAGYGDVTTKAPIEENTTFGVGSITKIFVAVVIFQLIQENKISLTDRVDSLVDNDILEGIPQAKEASIASLLSHTAGIPSWEDDGAWIQDGRGRYVQPDKIWTKQETLRYVKKPHVPAFETGKFHYANTNYTLLGLIIEKITQNTAETEVRRRITTPLGMKATYFEGFEHPSVESTPHRYHWATETFRRTAGISSSHVEVRADLVDVTGTNLSVSWTAGGIISNTSDLLTLAIAIQTGRLLNPTSTKILIDWHEAFESQDMGHGTFRLKNPHLSKTWVGHNGGVLGFTGALWWTTDGACAVSVLSNVGGSHAGDVPSSAAYIALKTPFLQLAERLAGA